MASESFDRHRGIPTTDFWFMWKSNCSWTKIVPVYVLKKQQPLQVFCSSEVKWKSDCSLSKAVAVCVTKKKHSQKRGFMSGSCHIWSVKIVFFYFGFQLIKRIFHKSPKFPLSTFQWVFSIFLCLLVTQVWPKNQL